MESVLLFVFDLFFLFLRFIPSGYTGSSVIHSLITAPLDITTIL